MGRSCLNSLILIHLDGSLNEDGQDDYIRRADAIALFSAMWTLVLHYAMTVSARSRDRCEIEDDSHRRTSDRASPLSQNRLWSLFYPVGLRRETSDPWRLAVFVALLGDISPGQMRREPGEPETLCRRHDS